MTDARAMLNAAFWAGLRPDPVMSIAEWAALHRVLSRSTSGEPGPWRNERTPYLIEIMEALSPSSTVETVVFVAGSQIGKTEVGNNFMGYVVDQAPGPMLFVLPTEGAAENVSKERLKPLFEESPTLRGKVKDARKKDSGNTLLRKEFPGGFLKLVSADSPAQLRSTPARYLFGDEVDAYPYSTGHEGDPCQLARRGQITFRRRKALWTSTPTLAGQSKIWKLLERTDIRHYLVPCPHCGHEQRLVWAQLKFNPEAHGAELRASVHYECEACQAAIDEGAKTEMLARGRWEPSQEAKDAKSRGYHLSTLYSPWYAWAELAQDFLNAKNDPAELKVFVNTKLGECWEEKGEKPDWRRLYERREAWPRGTVPFGATVLTAAVDVQGNRLEYQVDGWGPDRERWGIEYGVLAGDPSQDEVWRELWELLDREWPHESGVGMRIRRIAVDSGHLATEVYKQCSPRRRPRTTIVVKGQESLQIPIQPPVSKTAKTRAGRAKASVYMVGTSLLKSELYHALQLDKPVEGEKTPAGYIHFPEYYPPEYFQQITAEEIRRKRDARGFWKYEWTKTGERNEALDLSVYSRAAAADVGVDRWGPAQWATERRNAGLPEQLSAPQPPRRKPPRPARRGGSRYDRWRR